MKTVLFSQAESISRAPLTGATGTHSVSQAESISRAPLTGATGALSTGDLGARPISRAPLTGATGALPARLALFAILCVTVFSAREKARAEHTEKSPDVLLASLQQELSRAKSELAKADPPPYFIGYSASDQDEVTISATFGGLLNSIEVHRRSADVVMRVGSPALDNTHGENRDSAINFGLLPLSDDRDAIARDLWLLTDREYKKAAPTFSKVKTDAAVRSEEEDKSPDFSTETPGRHADEKPLPPPLDRGEWEGKVRRLSALFDKYAEVERAIVTLEYGRTHSYLVSSEGTTLVMPESSARLVLLAQTRGDDGMELVRVETFQAPSPAGLPAESAILPKIQKMAADLSALRRAPVAEPYSGPALLSGRAAAVFFHEVLGHRLEGHRQRGEEEGQTFTKKVGQLVMPNFLSVADDPTLTQLGGSLLAGAYPYDNEGVPAQRVEVIQNGVLKDFLTSRMPFKGFSRSNGHGRSSPGKMPTGRQGNLIVSSTKTVKDSELRQRLIDEVKKQGKPFGLYFEDIQGGFTLTQRSLPQAFQVLPVMVWRVYADGRPDELVRGVDIVGTPLASLTHIEITGDTQQVFNGVCGAESGWVPVAAVAPALLFSEMEVQKRAKSHDRPPILPPPGFEHSAEEKKP